MPAVKCVKSLVTLSLNAIPQIVKDHATKTAERLVNAWWKQKQESEKKSNFKFQNRAKVF